MIGTYRPLSHHKYLYYIVFGSSFLTMSRVDNVWNNYDLYVMLQLNGETRDIILISLKFSNLLTKSC